MVHGPWPRVEADTDWNNDRNDLRHLTTYASKEMFKMPLAWQTFDVLRGLQTQAKGLQITEDDYQAVTVGDAAVADPVHHRPSVRRRRASSGAEKQLLKRYVENGGFIFAEACCGSKEFDEGFKDLVARALARAAASTSCPRDHPVYTAYARVHARPAVRRSGASTQGCKTVLVYSPQDLSCRWEKGEPDGRRNACMAFRLGRQHHRLRHRHGAAAAAPDEDQGRQQQARPIGPPRAATCRSPSSSCPATRRRRRAPCATCSSTRRNTPASMSSLDHQATVRRRSRRSLNYKFLYMHGRKAFRFDPTDLDDLRFNLQSGGLLVRRRLLRQGGVRQVVPQVRGRSSCPGTSWSRCRSTTSCSAPT